jgi:hypothetical protein
LVSSDEWLRKIWSINQTLPPTPYFFNIRASDTRLKSGARATIAGLQP